MCLRRVIHVRTHWMLCNALTKFDGYVYKSLLELVISKVWHNESELRVREYLGKRETEYLFPNFCLCKGSFWHNFFECNMIYKHMFQDAKRDHSSSSRSWTTAPAMAMFINAVQWVLLPSQDRFNDSPHFLLMSNIYSDSMPQRWKRVVCLIGV